MKKINNNSIFSYLKASDNEMFSKLSIRDQNDIFMLLDKFYLVLRDNLGLDDYITFGLELEHEHAKEKLIEENLLKIGLLGNWDLGKDSSLNFGGELHTPILRDKLESWEELDKACKILRKYSKIGPNSGGHVHVGTQVLGFEYKSWLKFLKIWAGYENIIYRFSYGTFLSGRPNIDLFAEDIALYFKEVFEKFHDKDLTYRDITHELRYASEYGVNLINVSSDSIFKEGNTIEFRCPNGTLDPVIWQNYVNLFTKLLLYCKSNDYNNNIVDERFNEIQGNSKMPYNKIYLEQSLEFADLIFNNNIDKIYFLRQYLKSFESSEIPLKKARKFIKN